MIDEEEYFQVIEHYLQRKRGNPYPLSSKESALVLEWYEEKIPAEVVMRGIDRAFEKRTEEKWPPLSLMYCKRLVRSEYKKHLKSLEGTDVAGAGDAAATVQPGNVREFLERLIVQLGESAAAALQAGNRALGELLIANKQKLEQGILIPFRHTETNDLQRVEEQLTGLEREIEQLMLQTLPGEQLERLKEEAMRELKTFETKLDLAVYQEMVRRAVIKSVRKTYRIPRLSLFYM